MDSDDGSKPKANGGETFEPRPTVKYASAVGLQAALVGTLVSTVQNALGSHNQGAMGVFTRSGGTIGFFGAFVDSFIPSFIYIIFVCSRDGGNLRCHGVCRREHQTKGRLCEWCCWRLRRRISCRSSRCVMLSKDQIRCGLTVLNNQHDLCLLPWGRARSLELQWVSSIMVGNSLGTGANAIPRKHSKSDGRSSSSKNLHYQSPSLRKHDSLYYFNQ